ncbi:hypothetical protein BCR42DRAFT_467842 [Absidia repens]|uniref:Uncharacterized protein n=1 Tax=Absidia repens TaxID=90262 RepID=A0A1X2IAH1_9FUNG|nr:hypothetical protein BCR42DRAFT_467842 [Absidia repens]
MPSRSFSTSITSNRKLHYPTPSYSGSPLPHSLQQQQQIRRNSSHVGRLVQRFEIGRRPEPSTHDCGDIMASGMDSKTNDHCSSSSQNKTLYSSPELTAIDTSVPSNRPTRSPSSSTPLFCFSPGPLTTPTSTRAIDYRSIGFRPAFSSWESRITGGGHQMLVSSPSHTSPIWSTHCRRQSHHSP